MAGTVTATMIYNADLPIYKKEKLYASNIPCPPGVPTTNHRGEFRDGILITDMRHDLKGYHLDKQGFEVVRHGLRIDRSDFEDDAWVEHNYYPIIEEMLQNRLGNVRVQIFDHTVRFEKNNIMLSLYVR
ncbi:hypothetical protein F5B19DRAFT_498764 [Rostrohypoxylon terebratum]|nr:hypothetical protein F5B19DRAFT_498764 [Rostrohypoxylon terebratum]